MALFTPDKQSLNKKVHNTGKESNKGGKLIITKPVRQFERWLIKVADKVMNGERQIQIMETPFFSAQW